MRLDHPVIGVRAWSSSLSQGVYLRAIGPCAPGAIGVWQPGVNEARCGTPAAHEAIAGLNQPVPAHACGCGFHAYHDWEDVPQTADWGDVPYLTGIVLGWGSMHLHPDGWRSQYAEILALVHHPRTEYDDRVRKAAERYQVPTVPLGAMPEIAVEFGDPVPRQYRPRPKKGA